MEYISEHAIELATLLLAVFAGVVAWWQLKASREATAKSLYGSFLQLAVAHPELAVGNGGVVDERYRWFVAAALTAFDEILETSARAIWMPVIKGDLRYHAAYLRSEKFLSAEPNGDGGWVLYSEKLKKLAEEIEEYPS